MRSFAFFSCLAAVLAITVSAASLEAVQLNMGIGLRTNGRWAAASPPGTYLETEKDLDTAAAAAIGASASGAQSQMDSLLTLPSGIRGLARVELPLDAISAAAFGSANTEQIVASQNGDFTLLTHRDFPSVSIRIKQLYSPPPASELKEHDIDPQAFCDPTVTSWSGYIDTAYGGKSLWFYFFESRSNPSNDPVILWTNGGPGCSSSLGLFMELGPCRIPERGGKLSPGPPINGTKWHPQSWTNRANVFFIDQPVGVGYSYSKTDQRVYTTEEAARDVYAFLRVFFTAFERFRNNDFYMAGESYGGRYIPIFASEVADRNQAIERKALKAGKKVNKDELVKLKGILIGNGLTDVSKQISGYYDMTCTKRGGVEPILSIQQCKRMHTYVPQCKKQLAAHCVDSYNRDVCELWLNKCSDEIEAPYFYTGQNPYNIKDDCKSGLSPNLCYDVTDDIRKYLDRDDVRNLVGAMPKDQIGKFASCNEDVNAGFSSMLDMAHDNGFNVAGLLERGIKALIYVGTLDWICNHNGNYEWVSTLDWSGSEAWKKGKSYDWVVDGETAGRTQSGGGLTWATVYEAGHMVPYDQPDAALAMLNRWLDGQQL
ncbi:related to PRC1 - carboxypeptidase y, serine-type protease [Melanopsichium pennsylvanicum]|uniref:Carboxypeptidase n=2 Tax=Melanopsichium pennsylvanicum TaxID=63383 RepID=A0AAJ4XRE9_9BASI|nr:related to PRC1-carboxypeptidase y, serine-type protease [Melanopsichium pennsylvanicum 4]SNX86992.1 related to PRC1 - carboxypeptidase y, serine-type protease [Melanopsichium pennsylvanicum]